MTDRALQIAVGCSLVLHALAALALAGASPTTRLMPPPAQAAGVRVRLAGPPTPETPASQPESKQAPPAARRAEPAPNPTLEALATESAPAVEVAPEARTTPQAEAALAALDLEPPTSTAIESEGVPDEAGAADLPSPRAGVEDQSDRLARYVEEIRRRIEARKRYPAMARRRAVEGRVVARVEIGADGRIAAIAFEAGAPPLLRRATDEAIRAGEPYPAPPAGALTIELPVDYALRDAS